MKNLLIIGAGSVVVKDIPSNSVAVGIPAKVIKFNNQTILSNDEKENFIYSK